MEDEVPEPIHSQDDELLVENQATVASNIVETQVVIPKKEVVQQDRNIKMFKQMKKKTKKKQLIKYKLI
ncbi:hypothetical protein BpHYR1_040673 [Brachionus plicatilis]|uniref:Uncharacterized protein n=1 Tax=Brachionus plicatilis TaxID=10195 RepID=A0A3M7RMU2_BRAPC|nr:hypothetical protein BpHYR1_040673 [Brachionus plicatilis]